MRDGCLPAVKDGRARLHTSSATLIEKCKLSKVRIYASGSNLAVFSSFKLWDPEMGGNGLVISFAESN